MTRGKSDVQPIAADYMPTEQEVNEWTKWSIKEGIYGILDCFNKPTKQCENTTINTVRDISPRIQIYCQTADSEHDYSSLNDDGGLSLYASRNDESEP